jgi:S1-C subfamily serine protease
VQVDESGNLVIARILGGGMIDRQGLLHVGDTILEVNGVHVSSPEDLQIEISKAKESVALKIGPSFEDTHAHLDGGQV